MSEKEVFFFSENLSLFVEFSYKSTFKDQPIQVLIFLSLKIQNIKKKKNKLTDMDTLNKQLHQFKIAKKPIGSSYPSQNIPSKYF